MIQSLVSQSFSTCFSSSMNPTSALLDSYLGHPAFPSFIRHSAVHKVFLHKLAHRSQTTACFHRAADEMKVGSCVNLEAYGIYLRMVGLVGGYFCRSLSSSRSHWVQTRCQLVFASGNVPFKAKQAMGFMGKPSLIAKAPLGLSAFMNMKSIKLGTIFT